MKTNSAWQKTLQACDSQALIKASGCKWSILQTALLYFHSIRPGATRTDLVISWHCVFKSHSVEQHPIWVWQPTVWKRPVKASCWTHPERWQIVALSPVFETSENVVNRSITENWFWTGHWKLQQSTCLPVTCWHSLSSELNWKFWPQQGY